MRRTARTTALVGSCLTVLVATAGVGQARTEHASGTCSHHSGVSVWIHHP